MLWEKVNHGSKLVCAMPGTTKTKKALATNFEENVLARLDAIQVVGNKGSLRFHVGQISPGFRFRPPYLTVFVSNAASE
jgi:hypothetical protein